MLKVNSTSGLRAIAVPHYMTYEQLRATLRELGCGTSSGVTYSDQVHPCLIFTDEPQTPCTTRSRRHPKNGEQLQRQGLIAGFPVSTRPFRMGWEHISH